MRSTQKNYKTVGQATPEDIALAQELAEHLKKAKGTVTINVGESNIFAIKQIPYGIGSQINLYTIHIQPTQIPVISVKANAVDLFLPSCKIRIIVKTSIA